MANQHQENDAIKTIDTLPDYVRGYVQSACDPSFANPFHDIINKIENIELEDFGIREDESVTIEVPITFFARAGKGSRLKMVSLGGYLDLLSEQDFLRFNMGRLIHENRLKQQEIEMLREDQEKHLDALEALGFFGEIV